MMNTNTAYNAENSFTIFEILHDKDSLDKFNIDEAKQLFEEYQSQGIFLNDNFDDPVWKMTDEYQRRSIRFNINKKTYSMYYKAKFGLSYESVVNYLKTFIIYSVGQLAVLSLVLISNSTVKLMGFSPDVINQEELIIKMPLHVENFIDALPIKDDNLKEQLCSFLNTCAANQEDADKSDKRRELCDFSSYFKFGYFIKKYWETELSEVDRMFYFPVYLWWRITGIIPTRPREFLLTPRDCLHRENGINTLTMRKNRLKGGNQKIHYNIEADYEYVYFPISDDLANQIEDYIKATEQFEDNELHTLFRAEPHYRHFHQSKHITSRFYTYINLKYALRMFHYKVLNKQFGLEICYSREPGMYDFDKNNIQYLQLGDTRHIAMINAIAEGVSPEIVMQMAGHDSVEMSTHYYTNMSTYIECRTYAYYMLNLSDKEYVLGKNYYAPMNTTSYLPLEKNGKCYSKAMAEGKISDCIAATGENGEIGYCPGCKYYRAGDFLFFWDQDDIYKNKINETMNHLQEVVKIVRQGKGLTEDIKEIMLKFRSDKHDFEQYLMAKFKEREK